MAVPRDSCLEWWIVWSTFDHKPHVLQWRSCCIHVPDWLSPVYQSIVAQIGCYATDSDYQRRWVFRHYMSVARTDQASGSWLRASSIYKYMPFFLSFPVPYNTYTYTQFTTWLLNGFTLPDPLGSLLIQQHKKWLNHFGKEMVPLGSIANASMALFT
jgi:hypothetical protein